MREPAHVMTGFSRWEKQEHGDKCKQGIHMHYRVRMANWIQVRCKLCKYMTTELYEQSFLTRREEMAA